MATQTKTQENNQEPKWIHVNINESDGGDSYRAIHPQPFKGNFHQVYSDINKKGYRMITLGELFVGVSKGQIPFHNRERIYADTIVIPSANTGGEVIDQPRRKNNGDLIYPKSYPCGDFIDWKEITNQKGVISSNKDGSKRTICMKVPYPLIQEVVLRPSNKPYFSIVSRGILGDNAADYMSLMSDRFPELFLTYTTCSSSHVMNTGLEGFLGTGLFFGPSYEDKSGYSWAVRDFKKEAERNIKHKK